MKLLTTLFFCCTLLPLEVGCAKPPEFADVSPLEALLPANLKAEERVRHPVTTLFRRLNEEFFFHDSFFDWGISPYAEGEDYERGGPLYTWNPAFQWQDLPSEIHEAWNAILLWHRSATEGANRRLIAGFDSFIPIYSFGRDEVNMILDGLDEKEEALAVFAHLAQVMWEESTIVATDSMVSLLWSILEDSPHFTKEQFKAARSAYALDKKASLQRTRLLLVEAIRGFETGVYDDNPDAFSLEERIRFAEESTRMVEILSSDGPYNELEVLFLRSTLVFERVKYHSYFLDEETNLPWATPATPEQTSLHFAQRESTTDYYAPFRAKVWEQGQWATGTGFLGVDEQGIAYLTFHPRDLRLDDALVPADGTLFRMEIQREADRSLLAITNLPEVSSVTLSSLFSEEPRRPDSASKAHWPWNVWPSLEGIPLVSDPEKDEWSLTLTHAEGEEVLIFGQGGPWSERPDGAISIFAEPEPGRFTRDGVELVAPYWNLKVTH